jgi:hypothetical protein
MGILEKKWFCCPKTNQTNKQKAEKRSPLKYSSLITQFTAFKARSLKSKKVQGTNLEPVQQVQTCSDGIAVSFSEKEGILGEKVSQKTIPLLFNIKKDI